MEERNFCQSCGMPLDAPESRGTEADGTLSRDYCCYCYQAGKFTADCTMEQMIEECAPMMAEHLGWSVDQCASLMGAVLPNLTRWK